MAFVHLFRRYLRDQGLPVTQQREAIAEVVFSSPEHLSVEEIETALRERGERIGKATIYRTLDLLLKAGLIREHDFGDGFRRYEARPSRPRHEHLVCTRCGKVIEFESDAVERLEQEIAGLHRFHPTRHRLEIYGLCEECHD